MEEIQFANRLKQAPDSLKAVEELFCRARERSENRFFIAIMDLQWIKNESKNYPTFGLERPYIIQQFSNYFEKIVDIEANKFGEKTDQEFIHRLQMLAYSQIWEFTGLQRLLYSLVKISNNEKYDPELLIKNKLLTYEVFKEIRNLSKKQNLLLYNLLTAIYSNQIRNAFVHGEMWFVSNYISLFNYNPEKEYSIPSLSFDTWLLLFKKCSDFIKALFKHRISYERELRQIIPYKVELPEFVDTFIIIKDDRGLWKIE